MCGRATTAEFRARQKSTVETLEARITELGEASVAQVGLAARVRAFPTLTLVRQTARLHILESQVRAC